MRRLLRRLLVLAVFAGVATAVMRRLSGGDDCGPGCDCSQGAEACDCGHATCLTPAEA